MEHSETTAKTRKNRTTACFHAPFHGHPAVSACHVSLRLASKIACRPWMPLALSLVVVSGACRAGNPDTTNTAAVETRRADELVDVTRVIPGLVLDIRYATTNNFTHQVLYPAAKCALRREAAENLRDVQMELRGRGLALRIFDGYRPLSVQRRMWAVFPDDNYVANPAKGSRHNRGAAVDLTLIKLDGSEVTMPTPYDDFTEKAHRDYMRLTPEAIKNRELLAQVMTRHHFTGLPTEWWHFDLAGWEKYGLLDIDYSAIH
jgi:D-alanyl-D-alanine dipeptidase